MSGNSGLRRFFFSKCSDHSIKAYVTSDQANCLRKINEHAQPVIRPDFESVLAPTLDEQSRALLSNPAAVVEMGHNGLCTPVHCWLGSHYWNMAPMENTPCSKGVIDN